jgi:hypothetical protein
MMLGVIRDNPFNVIVQTIILFVTSWAPDGAMACSDIAISDHPDDRGFDKYLQLGLSNFVSAVQPIS